MDIRFPEGDQAPIPGQDSPAASEQERPAAGWWLPAVSHSVSDARHRIAEVLRHWGQPDDRVETAALCASELVSNAVRFSDAKSVWCEALRAEGRIRIHVWNQNTARHPETPQVPAPGGGESACAAELPEGGRGLLIVSTIADDWGSRTCSAGCLVWADV
ncbi:ATP-binding protein [Streptomyces sp. NPDC058045]|uniref:ATP-binding protein n=1 Tax=Streptomyces sp. NPDC058045 TaxID=3346311 RepID=UPI0036E71684